jgi:chromosome segregation ATPase
LTIPSSAPLTIPSSVPLTIPSSAPLTIQSSAPLTSSPVSAGKIPSALTINLPPHNSRANSTEGELSPIKLIPQTSNDLIKSEQETLQDKKNKLMEKLSLPTELASTESNNVGLKALIVERKKNNATKTTSVIDELAEEASRLKREKDNEIFKVLEARKKKIEGENASPVKDKLPSSKDCNDDDSSLSTDDQSSSNDYISPSLPPLPINSKKRTSSSDSQLQSLTKNKLPHESSPSSTRPSDELIDCKQQLNEMKKKYDMVYKEKVDIENEKLDAELEIRSLKCQIDQLNGDIESSRHDKQRLTEQLDNAEKFIKEKLENAHSSEMSMKEIEVSNKSLKTENEQLEDEIQTLTQQLESERQQRNVTELALQEQKKHCNLLKDEANKITEQNGQMSLLLDKAEKKNATLEEKIIILKETNENLKSEMQVMKSQCEEMKQTIEGLRDEISSHKDKELTTKSSLTEMNNKVELLTATLDKELEIKKSLDGQVSSLTERLTMSTHEVSQLKLDAIKHDRDSIQHAEQLSKDKSSLEMELYKCKEDKQHLQIQLDNIQTRLITLEQELKSNVTSLNDKSNQISNLQRQVDQNQLHQFTTQESIQREKDKVTQLESQLASLNEKYKQTLDDHRNMAVKIEASEKRAADSETGLRDEKIKLNAVIESLETKMSKVKDELKEKMEANLSLREQLASHKGSMIIIEKELQQLQEEEVSQHELASQLSEKLKISEDAYEQVELEKQEVEKMLHKTKSQMEAKERQLNDDKDVINQFKEVLNKAQISLQETANERDELISDKAELESKLIHLDGKMKSLLSDLELSSEKEKCFRSDIDKLNESRLSLQELASKLRSETVQLANELEEMKCYRLKAEQECSEVKELWENELKAKHKIMEKFMILEQNCKESGETIDTVRNE